jgi:hypothetical protein
MRLRQRLGLCYDAIKPAARSRRQGTVSEEADHALPGNRRSRIHRHRPDE